jgi:aryl-alcohol dehydrogenase-like predicted oxidoreductase
MSYADVVSRRRNDQVGTASVLSQPDVGSALVGAPRHEQVELNGAASGATVDPALFKEAERIIETAHGVRA